MSPIEQHPEALATGRHACRGIHSQQFEPGEALERGVEANRHLLELRAMIHREHQQAPQPAAARRRPVQMVQPRVLAQRSMRAAVGEVVIQLRESRELGRAQQARDRQRSARVAQARADLVRLAPQIAAQKTGQKRVPGPQRVVDLDVQPGGNQSLFKDIGDIAGKHDATPGAALAHHDRIRQGADMAKGFERIVAAGRDVHLLLGSYDEIAIGQHRSEGTRGPCRRSVAGFAGIVSADSPQLA